MDRFVRSFCLVFFAALTAFPQAPEIVSALDAHDRAEALVQIEKLRTSNQSLFKTGDYDYLVGKLSSQDGDVARAVAALQRIAASDSALKPYALKNLAEFARSTGNLMLERIFLIELLEFAPNSVPAKSAHSRLARNYFETANFAETVRVLTIREGSVKAENSRNDRLLLATAYLKLEDVEKARQLFTELLDQTPNQEQPDDIALEAVVNLDAIFGGVRGKTPPQLTEAEHMRRAAIYQFNREFADARLHYQAVIAGYPASSGSADAAFNIGRGLAQETNYLEALKWFERVIEQYPQSGAAKDALLQAASAYARVSRPKEAINRYELFIERYPEDARLDRAYLNIVDIVRDQGEDTEALRRCDTIRELFKGKPPEAIALFTQVRVHLAREDWPKAVETIDKLRLFSDLGGSRVPGGTSREELAFLRAYSLEKQKKFSEAVEAYLAIPDGRGEYYGWRANGRLNAIAADPDGKGAVAVETGRAASSLSVGDAAAESRHAVAILRLSADPDLRRKAVEVLRKHAARMPAALNALSEKPAAAAKTGNPFADRLIAMRLFDEAAAELESAAGPKSLAALEAYHRGDRADLLIAAVEPLWQNVPADRPLESLPRHELELLYPVAFRDETVANASALGVDPRLMLAIMRQESRFRTDAKSNAAARGLMQFISTTSNPVAAKLGRDRFRQEELYTPSTAIALGSRYLKDLFEKFPEQPEAVVASYNGGDDNMRRWFNRARSNEPERYVPEVVYAQSKDYVHKVMASYRVYQYLYDEKLTSRKAEVQ
jgi:soluble lytic murein transglycosylase-like protein/tetratricopeptide (TPR) repeat protein